MLGPTWSTSWSHHRHFSSNKSDGEETAEESSDGEEETDDVVPDLGREYSLEEKEAEAAAIGYKVVGPLKKSDRVFKRYEPVFAVVQVILCDLIVIIFFFFMSQCLWRIYLYSFIFLRCCRLGRISLR